MAVTHITEAEAARDFASVMAKVRAGEEVRIGDANTTIAILRAPQPEQPRHRTLSEILHRARERGSNVTLDDQFGNDLEAIIEEHRMQPRFDPWE